MAFFALSTLNIALISVGILFVLGVLIVVALKIFHQNKEEQQVALAEKGMELAVGEIYTVGKNIAEGRYSFAAADPSQNELHLTLNDEEKTLQKGDVLVLAEDDVLCVQAALVATIHQ